MTNYHGMEVAIIGMAGRFPGASDINSFWKNIKNGVESISFLSNADILAEGEDKVMLDNPQYVKASAYLNEKEYFDSYFFGYRPEEAKLMDPSLRIFHEQCWLALNDAGYNVRKKAEKIGLFAGANPNINWDAFAIMANRENLVDEYTASQLRDVTYLCSRISYLLDLQGPSVFINTACSTSLVAVQRASMSLLLRECTVAVAGGITINNFSKKGYLYQEGMINSKDGHCRAFDETSSGTIGSEGVGVVVLKRLEDAIKDRDNIYAIIKGSAVNNDGHEKISFTAPSVDGQSKAIMKAISMAKVNPESISYIETHGTGTRLGDPVEIEALNRVFGKSNDKYCAIGSVKTNIGHLNAASGIAGLIKTVLSLRNRQVPPSLHFNRANVEINFTSSPFYVNKELQEWTHSPFPLRAGVSSFGIGGTNAHIILEEAPELRSSSASRDYQLIVFSAKTATSLARTIDNFRGYIKEKKDEELPDIAYTLQVFQEPFDYRKFYICSNIEDLLSQMSYSSLPQAVMPVTGKNKPYLVFMFPGQGSQYVNMCSGLYQKEIIFKKQLDICFTIIYKLCGKNLLSVVFSELEASGADAINNTEFTQPLLFSVEFALAMLLMEWGIHPDFMIGHSLGEYVSACVSGVLSLEDALTLIIKRGELMQKVERGAMLSVSIPEKELRGFLNDYSGVSLAAVNSPELSVVSGTATVIQDFKTGIEQKGYCGKIIRTSHAFHSHMMDPILEAFHDEVSKINFSTPKIPYISNLFGELASYKEISQPQYWVNHLRQTVLFSKGVEVLLKNDEVVFIEIGPGNALSTFVRSHPLEGKQHRVVSLMKRANDSTDDLAHLFTAMGRLWERGIEPSWQMWYANELRRKVSLPLYGFDKLKYPVHVDAFKMISLMLAEQPMVKNADFSKWFYVPTWKYAPFIKGSFPEKTGERVLLFTDECGIGEALSKKYQEEGREIICVSVGEQYCDEFPFSFKIDPNKTEDYKQLFSSLSSRSWNPHKIIHAWGICLNSTDSYESYCNLFFYSLLEILQSDLLLEDKPGRQIVLLTSDLHPITTNNPILATKSLSIGLLKVLSQELPSVYTSHIDISLAEKLTEQSLNDLYREIQHKEAGKIISMRLGLRWKRIYDPIGIDMAESTQAFREGGVYLITGGLGDLGFAIASQLLKRLKARLVLVGRTELPSPSKWAELLIKEETREAIKNKIKKLQALVGSGGDVLYLSCNITDKQAVEDVVKKAELQWGSINGIIHAAGIVKGDSIRKIRNLTRDDFEIQFASKIKGLQILKEVTANKNLDFCLLTSSLSVVLGGWGFGAYVPANIFMDYYIKSWRNLGQLKDWISVDLDALNFVEETTDAIKGSEIFEVINQALNFKELPNIVVSATDLGKRLEKWMYRNIQTEDAVKGEEFGREAECYLPSTVSEPVGGTAMKLLKLWQSFFGKPTIGIDDDFFEIGGDSLKALTIIARIHKTLNIEVSLQDFFSKPTLRSLSEAIDERRKAVAGKSLDSSFSPIVKVPVREHYKLSSAQKRLYFLYELDKTIMAYNMSQAVRLSGDLDIARLNLTFKKLIARHENLRTSFEVVNDEPVQKIAQHVNFEIEHLVVIKAEVSATIDKFLRPFNLAKPPLFRVGLIKVTEQEHILIIDIAHIISDGVSGAVLVKEFMALYKDDVISDLRLQYKDFSEWQQSKIQQAKIAKHKQFWIEDFSGGVAVLDLPTDFARPLQKRYEGSCLDTYVDDEEMVRLKKMAEGEGCTLFMALMSIYLILLNKLSDQEDVVVGINTTGRQHADLENVIGLFVNTIPVRVCLDSRFNYSGLLNAVKSKVLACFDNQSYPYEQFLNEIKMERDSSRNPLFDVMFIYQNFQDERLNIPGLRITTYNMGNRTAKFDLTLTAVEENNRVHFFFEYSTSLFKEETIGNFIAYFKRIVTSVISDPTMRISDISL